MNRLEGLAKLTGAEPYLDDVPIEGCLWGMTVRSPSPRGRIRAIRLDPATDWSKFIVVDHRDIPGPNAVYLIEHDQPVLAAERTRHIHEAVTLVAHADRQLLRNAVRAVAVEVDPEPPYLDYRIPPRPDQIQREPGNVLKQLRIDKGDVDRALADAAHVIEGEYETGAQEHVYIEPQAMAAWVEGDVLVVKGSMQCPYYVVNALKHALALDELKIRVIQAPTGGGFGGKEEYPSILALHCALLSLKAGGRPVKMVYDRGEDMAATTKRHPSRVRHRTGVGSDGRLLAQDIEVLLDGGAYQTLSPVVLSRGIIHAAGPYFCENVRVVGKAMLTNAVPFGAFRGFGAPQTQFANERHMDRIARTLGMDPAELRRINLIRDGETTPTGQIIRDGADRVRVLDEALALAGYEAKKREHEAFHADPANAHLRRGIGLATFWHGAGFTGNGEVYLSSKLLVSGLPDGRIEILSASTEMGQGTNTIFTQIVARHLGLEPGDVVIATPDTSRVPNTGPTVASRTAMVVGRLIEKACDALLAELKLPPSARGRAVTGAIKAWHAAHPGCELRTQAVYEPPPGIQFDEKLYRGDAYAAFAWACQIAEVEVDLRTAATRVIDFVSVQDIGTVINEPLARGQVQGGVVQGIGWALMEEFRWQDGAMKNNQLTNYIIPTSDDVPPIRARFIQTPYPHGGGGAKGLGELPIDGPAPAVLNAVANATGADPCTIPLVPERLMECLGHEQAV